MSAPILEAVRAEIHAHETYLAKLREIERIAAGLYEPDQPAAPMFEIQKVTIERQPDQEPVEAAPPAPAPQSSFDPRDSVAVGRQVRRRILDHITQHPGVTSADLQEAVGASKGKTDKHLRALVAAGLIRRIAPDHGVPGSGRGAFQYEIRTDDDPVSSPIASAQEQGRQAKNAIVRHITEHGPVMSRQLQDALQLSQTRVDRALRALVSEGVLVRDHDGVKNHPATFRLPDQEPASEPAPAMLTQEPPPVDPAPAVEHTMQEYTITSTDALEVRGQFDDLEDDDGTPDEEQPAVIGVETGEGRAKRRLAAVTPKPVLSGPRSTVLTPREEKVLQYVRRRNPVDARHVAQVLVLNLADVSMNLRRLVELGHLVRFPDGSYAPPAEDLAA